MIHAVLGTGDCSPAAICESLKDALDQGDELILPWIWPIPPSLETVYGYVLDNEVPFTLMYSDADKKPPTKHFREADFGIVQKSRDPIGACISRRTGAVLYLWDDDSELIDAIFDSDPKVVVLELSNGLAPIVAVDAEEEEPAQPSSEESVTEDEVGTFTQGELEVMTSVAVKRYGERMGCTATTKAGIIEELFPPEVPSVYSSPFAPPPSSSFFVVALFPDKNWKIIKGGDHPITVYPNGTTSIQDDNGRLWG